MIILNLKGGLGNQMFQYACGRALACRNQDTLHMVREAYDGDEKRPFSLTHFNIQAELLSSTDVPKISQFISRLKQKITKNYHINFDPRVLSQSGHVYLDGYFQSEKYFQDYADLIRDEFTLVQPLKEHAADILNTIRNDKNAVSLHVRRGDYVTHSDFGGIATKSYYEQAIRHICKILPSATFYVFSDEINWCRTELPLGTKATYVSKPGLQDFEELSLMSYCTHHIIANSSFSWWGAWLGRNPQKTVIVPKKWANVHEEWYVDIVPPSWTRI